MNSTIPCNGAIYKFLSTAAFAIHFAACIISVIITLATVSLNSLTVLTFWRTLKLRKNILLYLVMILSMVDAGTGIFCYPSLTIRMIFELMKTPKCWQQNVQSNLFKLSSILSLSLVSAISIERYFGVMHPLIHRTQVTKKKLTLLLVLIWSISVFAFVASIFIDKSLNSIITISCAILILLTVYSYTRIAFAVIHSNLKREALQNANAIQGARDGEDVKQNRKRKMNILRQFKMSKSSFLIALCYLCCYMPTFLVFGVLANTLPASIYFLALPWCLLFVMLNSCLNSIIFFWRNASLRKETMNVLRNIKIKYFEK